MKCLLRSEMKELLPKAVAGTYESGAVSQGVPSVGIRARQLSLRVTVQAMPSHSLPHLAVDSLYECDIWQAKCLSGIL